MDRRDLDNSLDPRENLPEYYRGFREIEILGEALLYVLGKLNDHVQGILADQFMQTATARGITRFENLMGIVTDQSANLEARRAKVLQKASASSKFTRAILENTVREMCDYGEYNIKYGVTSAEYGQAGLFMLDLKVRIGRQGMLDVLWDLLYEMLPAHLEYYIHNHLPANPVTSISYALGARVATRYEIVDAIDEKESALLELKAGANVSISSKNEALDAIAQTINNRLELYASSATAVSQKTTAQKEPIESSAYTTARIVTQ